jgi:hypothetical protein
VQNLKGFYDAKEIGLGDGVLPGVKTSLVFVQIAETAMFLVEPEADVENWCFLEFEHYHQNDGSLGYKAQARTRKCAFLLGETQTDWDPEKRRWPVDAIRPAILPEPYAPWFEKIRQLRGEVLATEAAALESQMKDVARDIARRRDEVLDEVVPDYFVFSMSVREVLARVARTHGSAQRKRSALALDLLRAALPRW